MTRKTVRTSDILIYFVYVELNQFLNNSVRSETKTTTNNPTNGGDLALLPLTPELELAEIRNELTIWPGRCFVDTGLQLEATQFLWIKVNIEVWVCWHELQLSYEKLEMLFASCALQGPEFEEQSGGAAGEFSLATLVRSRF